MVCIYIYIEFTVGKQVVYRVRHSIRFEGLLFQKNVFEAIELLYSNYFKLRVTLDFESTIFFFILRNSNLRQTMNF